MGAIAPGDLSFGSVWGDKAVIFAMDADTDAPLSFYIISTEGTPSVQVKKAQPMFIFNFPLSSFSQQSFIFIVVF